MMNLSFLSISFSIVTVLQCARLAEAFVPNRSNNHHATSFMQLNPSGARANIFYASSSHLQSTSDPTNSDSSSTATVTVTTTTTTKSTNSLQSGYDTTDGYERFLYSKSKKKKNKRQDLSLRRKITFQTFDDGNDDGYEDMMKKGKKRPLVQNLLLTPFKIGMKVTKKMFSSVPEPGTLILVRHGESEWNMNKTFTVSIKLGLEGEG